MASLNILPDIQAAPEFASGWYAATADFLQKYAMIVTVVAIVIILVLGWYLWTCMGKEKMMNPSAMYQDTDDAYGLGDRSRSYFSMAQVGSGIQHYNIKDLQCDQQKYFTGDALDWIRANLNDSSKNANFSPDAPDQNNVFDVQGNMAGHQNVGTSNQNIPATAAVESFNPRGRPTNMATAPQVVGTIDNNDLSIKLMANMFGSDNPANIQHAMAMRSHGMHPSM